MPLLFLCNAAVIFTLCHCYFYIMPLLDSLEDEILLTGERFDNARALNTLVGKDNQAGSQ